MRKLLSLLIPVISIAVFVLACGDSGEGQEVVPTATSLPKPMIISRPAPSENDEINAIRGKVPEPCYAANTTEIFSATGAVAVYDRNGGGYINGGVGVVLNGYVLTAHHVIDVNLENGQPVIFLYVPSEEEITPVGINITYSDPEYDFSILKLDEASESAYKNVRLLLDSFYVVTLEEKIPHGSLCFFRFVYPPERGRPYVVSLPGEYPGSQTNVFTIVPGQDFMFESLVGGPGASGSPVFVRSSSGDLVLAGIVTEVANFIKVQGIEGDIKQANSAHQFGLDIGLICKRALENAKIDLCGDTK